MVVKPAGGYVAKILKFESSVILYGSQTSAVKEVKQIRFESSVILYGSQTHR